MPIFPLLNAIKRAGLFLSTFPIAALLLLSAPALVNAQTSVADSPVGNQTAASKKKPKPTPTPSPGPLDPNFIPTTGTQSWNTGTNWDSNSVPSGIDFAVNFASPTGAQIVTLDAAITIGSFTLTNNSTNTFSVSNGVGGSLKFDVSSGNATMTINGTGNVVNTIGCIMSLSDTLDITVNDTATTSVSGALTISGGIGISSGGIIKDGAGEMSFTNNSKGYTGSTTINNGILRLTFAAKPGGTSGVTVNSGGELLLDQDGQAWGTIGPSGTIIALNGAGPSSGGALRNNGTGTVSLDNKISLATDATIFENSAAGTLQLNGIISGSGGLIKGGTGTLALAAANTFNGTTTLGASSGTLLLKNTNALQDSTLNYTGSTLTFDSSVATHAFTFGGLSGSTNIALQDNAVTPNVVALSVGNNNASTSYSGVLSVGGSLTKVGTGTLTLSGPNTYSGKTTIANGAISASSFNSVSGGTANSNLGHPTTVANGTIDIGSIANTGQLTYTGSGQTTDRVINLAGTTGGATLDDSGTGTLTFSSNFTATGVGAKTLTLQGSTAGSGVISGNIVDSSSGATSVTKSGSGTWTLGGVNSYSGGTTASDGLLQLNSTSALGSTSGSLTVNAASGNAAILDLNGNSISVGNLTGTGGNIWNNGPNAGSSTVTLTIGTGNTGGGNYQGMISNNNGAAPLAKVALTKTGSGAITLSGVNTYTGATLISGGTLLVNGSTAAGSAVTVNSTGTLGGNGTVGGTVDVKSGGNLSPGSSPGILHTGALTLESGANYLVDLNNTTAGSGYDQTVVAGTVNLGGLLASNLVLNIGGTLSIGNKFFIVLNDSTDVVSGTFASGTTITSGPDVFLINYADNGDSGTIGNDISLTVTAVPEPSTWVGAALAMGAVLLTQRRRFKRLLVES